MQSLLDMHHYSNSDWFKFSDLHKGTEAMVAAITASWRSRSVRPFCPNHWPLSLFDSEDAFTEGLNVEETYLSKVFPICYNVMIIIHIGTS